jgi:hypothetical protein
MENTKYENIDEILVAALPDLGPSRELEKQKASGRHPGQYVLFMVWEPMINRWIDSQDATHLRPLFQVFERMANSKDKEVLNLLQLAFLERLVDDPVRALKAWGFMGAQTQRQARRTARALRRTANLPGRLTAVWKRSK